MISAPAPSSPTAWPRHIGPGTALQVRPIPLVAFTSRTAPDGSRHQPLHHPVAWRPDNQCRVRASCSESIARGSPKGGADERKEPYLQRNVEEFAPDGPVKKDDEFKESNRKHAINGLLYGNLDGLTLRKGERVRWYLMALGNENDIHTAQWHGATVLRRGSRVRSVEL